MGFSRVARHSERRRERTGAMTWPVVAIVSALVLWLSLGTQFCFAARRLLREKCLHGWRNADASDRA